MILAIAGLKLRFLKWGVVFGIVAFESPTVCLDEFQGVGNQLKAGPLNALVGLPFLLVQSADNGDTGPLVKMLFRDLGELVEAGDLDPVGLFPGGSEREIEGGNGIPLRAVKYLGISTQVASDGA